jgi:hypothetical protein
MTESWVVFVRFGDRASPARHAQRLGGRSHAQANSSETKKNQPDTGTDPEKRR